MVDWEDHLENNSNNNNSIEISRVLEVSVSHQVKSCVKLLNSAWLFISFQNSSNCFIIRSHTDGCECWSWRIRMLICCPLAFPNLRNLDNIIHNHAKPFWVVQGCFSHPFHSRVCFIHQPDIFTFFTPLHCQLPCLSAYEDTSQGFLHIQTHWALLCVGRPHEGVGAWAWANPQRMIPWEMWKIPYDSRGHCQYFRCSSDVSSLVIAVNQFVRKYAPSLERWL